MCGIVTIYGYGHNAPLVDREELLKIRDHMIKRGPDGKGEWFSEDGQVGMGHRRLSIIDLSERGSQPMKTPDGALVVSFNGEIYNYRELRAQLESCGYKFQSSSDTEILLHLYQEKGREMVHELRGMFAFTLWDDRKKGMLLARDPYGIKPLYFEDNGNTIRIASQVKALLAGGKISREFDPKGVSGFFLWGHIPEPYTLYKTIKPLGPGSTLWVDRNGVKEPEKFFSLPQIYASSIANPEITSPQDTQAIIRDALIDSIRAHFIADVPVGIFLSSGIDSGTLTALAKDSGFTNIRTITLGFEELHNTPNDETRYARLTAERYGTQHVTKTIRRSDFETEMHKVFSAMDQPSIDGFNTYFISKAANELGLKIVLSGIGADELFVGYSNFTRVPLIYRCHRALSNIPGAGKLASLLYDTFFRHIIRHSKGRGLIKLGDTFAGAYFLCRGLYLPDEISSVCPREFLKEGIDLSSLVIMIQNELAPDPGTDSFRVATLESSLYLKNQLLRDTDWAGMAHSVEIRTPYVDSFLVRKIANFLPRNVATSKREVLQSLPQKPLSNAILYRNKTGFSFPLESWIPHKSKPFSRVWANKVFHEFRN